jgi:predicted MPP superfamily phosphohydrolase
VTVFLLVCLAVNAAFAAGIGWRFGGRYALAAGVALTILTALSAGVYRVAGPLTPLVWYGQVATWLFVVGMTARRVRFPGWRAVVSWPASWFVAGAMLALPWSVTGITAGAWVPFAIATAGMARSLTARRETVTLDLSTPAPDEVRRIPMVRRRRGMSSPGHSGLRIVQISDPHLGPFMSEARLRGICERAVAAHPDLIVLTGDYFTRETHDDWELLARALAPLRAHPHVYACRGNHDLECPEAVTKGLEAAGVRLLIDEAVTVETRVGPVQIVGMDFHWRDRARKMRGVLVDLVRRPEVFRLVLLHDPGAFQHLADGAADLVLSGHTHGGHVGLVSLGLDWTAIQALASIPDHGGWGRGKNRLYVHRTHGHYGFPLRVGVPAEESVLEIVR